MTRELITIGPGRTIPLHALYARNGRAARRALEFFTTHIRNPHTRRAYARAADLFASWCDAQGLKELHDVLPIHVAAYVEGLRRRMAPPSVKVQLIAIRMLFDWLVLGKVIPMNPARVVRASKYPTTKGGVKK